MRDNSRFEYISGKIGWNSRFSIFIFAIIFMVFIAAALSVMTGAESGYTPTTYKCLSCHNDTDPKNDTDGDNVWAPFKRPHNGSIMCETCHDQNPHTLTYIQPDGSYLGKPTAASCPECHQAGVPNFTTAFMIPNPLRHSSDINNGSLWGNHWINSSPRSACIYCHDKTLHDVTPLGRIRDLYPDFIKNTSIGNGSSCAVCHYKEDALWGAMAAAFTSAGLEIPPEITNGTNWNGTYTNYFNHSIESYDDIHCKQCHGSLLSANATMSEFVHNVAGGAGEACIGCHTSKAGIYPGIDMASFGSHININRSDGNDTLTNDDCKTCHSNFNYSEMIKDGFTTFTSTCIECHISGNYSAPVIANHKPSKTANVTNRSAGFGINTTAYCSTCHNNSINKYDYSLNASVSHYGTNSSLVKTVNQTPLPRYGFFNAAEASAYNKECNDCHDPPNMDYGTPTNITFGHTRTAACAQCHINVSADNFHNNSLGLPANFSCIVCHKTYADKYNAPNLTGTGHNGFTCTTNCHPPMNDNIPKGELNLPDHNQDWTWTTTSYPTTGVVYLNNATSLIITKGTPVTVTSNISDDYTASKKASRVRGAEYYIDTDPGIGKGTYMEAVDGLFDAVNGKSENITGTINTSELSVGTYTVYVRGMDIGKLWSTSKSATLIVVSTGYINGTVTGAGNPLVGATVSITGGSTTTFTGGIYSLPVPEGIYDATASSFEPEYYDNTSTGIIVTSGNTTIQDFDLALKPTGTITGTVMNATE